MKNIFTLILFFSIVYFGKAQTIPNNDFENWENLGLYEEPVSWNTPNQFTSLIGGIGVTKSDDAFSGSLSARLETIEMADGAFQAPGLLTLSEFNVDIATQEFSFSGGFFLRENVSKLTGMYKYAGVDGDSASVVIYNFRHPEGEAMDTIGVGFTFLHDADDWTPFEVIMVNNNYNLPDTFNVMIISSGSEEMKIGSTLLVDNIAIETNTGIIDLWNPVTPLHVYPNPAYETITFEADIEASNRELIIYNLSGRIVQKTTFNNYKSRIDTKDFTPGMYSYSLIEDGKRICGGSFIKK